MRISDWISDVCSSDLETVAGSVVAGNLVIDAHRSIAIHHCADGLHAASADCLCVYRDDLFHFHFGLQPQNPRRGVDREGVSLGTSMSERVARGGSSIIKNTKYYVYKVSH